MRRRASGLLATALLGVACSAANAGTYLQSQGDLNYSTSVGYLFADTEWDERSNLRDSECDSDYAFLSQYFDYGYSYYYSLYGGVNLARTRCRQNPSALAPGADPFPTESKTGFGDVTAGIRGRIDPTRNDRAWEVELNIPTSRQTDGAARLGCGAFAVTGNIGTRERVTRDLRIGAEAGIQLWEAPLAHQFEGKLRANGAVVSSRTGWKWATDLIGRTPLDRSGDVVDPAVSDCGTAGTTVRGNFSLGYVPSINNYISCTAIAGFWGESATRRHGLFCGFSHLFKR